MAFAILGILALVLVAAVVAAILIDELAGLAWTIAAAVCTILVVSVGAAVVLGGGPQLATDPVGAVRTTSSLAAYVALGLTVLAVMVYSIRMLVVWRRRPREADERPPSRKPD